MSRRAIRSPVFRQLRLDVLTEKMKEKEKTEKKIKKACTGVRKDKNKHKGKKSKRPEIVVLHCLYVVPTP
jgi:hypothetical protein